MISRDYKEEIEKLAEPIVKLLNDHGDPYLKVIIDCGSIEVLMRETYLPVDRYTKD